MNKTLLGLTIFTILSLSTGLAFAKNITVPATNTAPAISTINTTDPAAGDQTTNGTFSQDENAATPTTDENDDEANSDSNSSDDNGYGQNNSYEDDQSQPTIPPSDINPPDNSNSSSDTPSEGYDQD